MKNKLVEKFDHFGRGIIKDNGKTIFVRNAVAGDIVDIDLTKNKKTISEAIIKKIVKPSPLRVKSPCSYSDLCGGCSLLNISYIESLKYKENRLKEIISKFAKINIKINPIIESNEFNYRNKITLHIKDKKIGLYKYNSNELIEIDNCMLVDEKINNIIKRIKPFIKEKPNNLEEVMIRVFNNKDLIHFKGKVEKKLLKNYFKDSYSLWLNNELLIGDKNLIVDFLDYKFVLSKEAFFQVNIDIASKIFNYIRNYIKDKKYKKALDLYCGVGVIGIVISPFVEKVIGIEIVENAVKNANVNKELNKINNISFITGKVENHINKFKDIDLVVVDPPRSGLDKNTINNIISIKPKEIIYVSCDAITLARDLNLLKEFYNIKEITPFDMFPNTYHVECISVLERKNVEK